MNPELDKIADNLRALSIGIQTDVLDKKKQLISICLSDLPSHVKINNITDLILQWVMIATHSSEDYPDDLKHAILGLSSTNDTINLLTTLQEPWINFNGTVDEIRSVIKSEITDDEKLIKIKRALV